MDAGNNAISQKNVATATYEMEITENTLVAESSDTMIEATGSVEVIQEAAGSTKAVDSMETSEKSNKLVFCSSQPFQLELNIKGRFNYYELNKLLQIKHRLKPIKIRTQAPFGGRDRAFVCFRSEKNREKAIKALDGYNWVGRQIHAKYVCDTLLKQRQEQNESKKEPRKSMFQTYLPLLLKPYNEQIKLKEGKCHELLRSYAAATKRHSLQLNPLILQNERKFNGLPCKWIGFAKSPLRNCYRNKMGFFIGKDANGRKTIGFHLGTYSDGSLEVEALKDYPHTPHRMRLAVRLFESYIHSSKYDVFNTKKRVGQFRHLAVRLAEATGEIMLIIGLHTLDIPNEVNSLLDDIVKYFTEGGGKELNVTSIFYEEMNKRDYGKLYTKTKHKYGAEYITDIILGLRIRVDSGPLFQIQNTKAAEVLYSLAIIMGKVNKDTSVVDICCGTGTISLCFAKYCKKVLGIDSTKEAIDDAKLNAKVNRMENCSFYTEKCDEFYLKQLISIAKNQNLLAVIDPPKGGLNRSLTDAIRNASGLKRFLYISRSLRGTLKNLINFSRPCSILLEGAPFKLKEAAGVDMFPHTNHQEMVFLFERL